MATPMVRSSSIPSLPPPSPKSPPEYPDLYGKRREMARIQMLEREIRFLQEELKHVEGLQPASRCIKEYVYSQTRRIAGHVASGNGSVLCLVLTSLGSAAAAAAVMGVHLAPLIALANALALALSQPVQRDGHAAAVESTVGILAGYVASVLYSFQKAKEKGLKLFSL
ncbi:hypothetical protein Lal_00006805 [Lupinus albus]|nr:hypothetical protein Lal_00006805 [Lupinus albus]